MLNSLKDKVIKSPSRLPYALGVAETAISKWEEENGQYSLPDDYKAFLQISDGLSLNWKIKKND